MMREAPVNMSENTVASKVKKKCIFWDGERETFGLGSGTDRLRTERQSLFLSHTGCILYTLSYTLTELILKDTVTGQFQHNDL